jgi:hypothetical protein
VSAAAWLVLAFAGLFVSAQARLTATVLGAPVSVPVLGLVALAVVLALLALVLHLARMMLRDGLRLRPAAVTT